RGGNDLIGAKLGKSVRNLDRVIRLARIHRLRLRDGWQDGGNGGANESEAAKLQELTPIGHACLRTNRLLPDEGLIESFSGLWPTSPVSSRNCSRATARPRRPSGVAV